MFLPVFIISSLTSPSPLIFILRANLSFENWALIVWSELTSIVNGFWVEPFDQPEKIKPWLGVAVKVIVDPDLNDPPEKSTLPPFSEITSIS